MNKNIIQILKAGNQELFYSSFIAWLMDSSGEHGLGDAFLKWFFNEIGESQPHSFKIDTEIKLPGGRFDIFIETSIGRKIIIENKTKSIGSNNQLLSYQDHADLVVPLGLLAENFPETLRHKVVTYTAILDFLRNTPRNGPLSIIVDHFIAYLEAVSIPFVLFDKYCNDAVDLNDVTAELSKCLNISLNDNDYRFFHAVYFERLKTFISNKFPQLVFGTDDYYESVKHPSKPAATKWIIEKNLQGPAYMEAIIYDKTIPGKLNLSAKWLPTFDKAKKVDMSPRIEFAWKGPDNFHTTGALGEFMLGCWDDELKKAFQASNIFNKKGTRNFHHRVLSIEDFKYHNMANIIIEEMQKIWVI